MTCCWRIQSTARLPGHLSGVTAWQWTVLNGEVLTKGLSGDMRTAILGTQCSTEEDMIKTEMEKSTTVPQIVVYNFSGMGKLYAKYQQQKIAKCVL